MIKSYIYGTPHGFNSCEDKSLDNYFKAFYISSRKGARLMVNRQPNGTIFYNYLHYELTEVGRRPNSFFGMSISIDNGKYCADFNQLFNWFDFIFQTLVRRGNILYLNEGNKIQYRVHKFDEVHNEIEWIKSNLPRIFDKEAFPEKAVELISLDSSFKEDNSGVIKCYNNETDQLKIITAFKQHRWLAISPIFPPEEEAFELHLPSVESCYNSYTEEILPIAINPKKSSLAKLKELTISCKENILSLEKYRKATLDEKEQEKSEELLSKFNELHKNIVSLINKIAEQQTPPPPPIPLDKKTKKCKKCLREEPFSKFDEGSDICRSCQSLKKEEPGTKKCPKCGKEKQINEFGEGNELCKECRRPSGFLEKFSCFISKNFKLLIIILIPIFIVVIIFVLDIPEVISNPAPITDNYDSIVVIDEGNETENNYVDSDKFNDLIKSKQFNEVVSCIEGKVDEASYKTKLSKALTDEIWLIFDTKKINEIESEVMNFISSNFVATNYVGIETEELANKIRDFKTIEEYIAKAELKSSEKEKAILLINSLPENMQEPRIILIQNKREPKTEVGEEQIKITITEKMRDGKIIETTTIGPDKTYTGSVGNFITISVNSGVLRYDTNGPFSNSLNINKNRVTVELKNSGDNVYKYINRNKTYTFTIEAKRK